MCIFMSVKYQKTYANSDNSMSNCHPLLEVLPYKLSFLHQKFHML
jgi:hypothetical protein